jgi:hypothetical protein
MSYSAGGLMTKRLSVLGLQLEGLRPDKPPTETK